jgi:hypothetical protein
MWLKRWFLKLIKLWCACAVVYAIFVAAILLLVHAGLAETTDRAIFVLGIAGFGAFIVIPISGLTFIILSAQRLLYPFVPEPMRKHVFWIKWLEDRERKRDEIAPT